jgi:hypothetical protein
MPISGDAVILVTPILSPLFSRRAPDPKGSAQRCRGLSCDLPLSLTPQPVRADGAVQFVGGIAGDYVLVVPVLVVGAPFTTVNPDLVVLVAPRERESV